MQIEEKPAFDTPFEWIGGESRVRALVDRFYDLMDLEPAYSALRASHGSTLDEARNKLFWFLCGWLGGPAHYVERFGHPRLRADAGLLLGRHPSQEGSAEPPSLRTALAQCVAHLGATEGNAGDKDPSQRRRLREAWLIRVHIVRVGTRARLDEQHCPEPSRLLYIPHRPPSVGSRSFSIAARPAARS